MANDVRRVPKGETSTTRTHIGKRRRVLQVCSTQQELMEHLKQHNESKAAEADKAEATA